MAAELKDEYPSLAQTLFSISTQEETHQAALHTEVVKLIEDHKKTKGEPPAAMMAVYEYIHNRHVEKMAEARRYQDIFKSR